VYSAENQCDGFWTAVACAEQQVFCGDHRGVVQLVDERTSAVALTFAPAAGHGERGVRVLRWQGERHVIATSGGVVRVHDVRKHAPVQRFVCTTDAELCSMLDAGATSSSSTLVFGDSAGACHRVDFATGSSSRSSAVASRGPVVGMCQVNESTVCLGSLYGGVRVGAPESVCDDTDPNADQSCAIYLELVGGLHYNGRDLFASTVGDSAVTILECSQNRNHRSWSDSWCCR
jgi:hypothetical protein